MTNMNPNATEPTVLASPRHGSSSQFVAEQLREAILRGEYPPNSRIRQEDLAARFGASRVPVREALRTLEAEGLVTLVANTGAWVRGLSLAECEEIYQIRERIEPLLLRYSIPNLQNNEDVLFQLKALCGEMEDRSSLEEFLHLDREFHLLTYSGANTTLLGDLTQQLWDRTQHYRRAYTSRVDPTSRRILHDEHHMLVAAIRDGDPDQADRVLTGHIQRTRHQLAKHPEIFDHPVGI